VITFVMGENLVDSETNDEAGSDAGLLRIDNWMDVVSKTRVAFPARSWAVSRLGGLRLQPPPKFVEANTAAPADSERR
jgi:hypothetical protein